MTAPGGAPVVHHNGHEKFERLVATAQRLSPAITAIAHPCDHVSLESAVEAAKLRLIVPILVGPAARIGEVAARSGLDIAGLEIVEAEHSHDAAAKAVALVRAGKAEALMKGSLHTDELMGAVVVAKRRGPAPHGAPHQSLLHHGHSRWPCPMPLIITDAAVNIAPTLEDKIDIVQNAIDLAKAMGVGEVRVAILSAMETVNPKVLSTVEAAALCKMADRGQITGGFLDGPLALDNAISPEAAAIKNITSSVAGRANVLVVPDLEAGTMLATSLSFLSGMPTRPASCSARACPSS